MGLEEGNIGFLLPVDGDADDLFFTGIDMEQIKRKFAQLKQV